MLGPVPVGAGAAGRTVALARENGVLTRSLARVGVALLPALTISEAEVEEIPARVRRALDGL
jgi:adenosylmethionine-8-amino-7-oxononanoate aminotransferase